MNFSSVFGGFMVTVSRDAVTNSRCHVIRPGAGLFENVSTCLSSRCRILSIACVDSFAFLDGLGDPPWVFGRFGRVVDGFGGVFRGFFLRDSAMVLEVLGVFLADSFGFFWKFWKVWEGSGGFDRVLEGSGGVSEGFRGFRRDSAMVLEELGVTQTDSFGFSKV